MTQQHSVLGPGSIIIALCFRGFNKVDNNCPLRVHKAMVSDNCIRFVGKRNLKRC